MIKTGALKGSEVLPYVVKVSHQNMEVNGINKQQKRKKQDIKANDVS